MLKRRGLALAVAALSLLTLPWASAQGGVFVSVGVPAPYYGPYYHRHYYYYGPRVYVTAPVVVAAPPPGAVYVQQPTVIYQQAPAPQPVAPTGTSNAPETVAPPVPIPAPAR